MRNGEWHVMRADATIQCINCEYEMATSKRCMVQQAFEVVLKKNQPKSTNRKYI